MDELKDRLRTLIIDKLRLEGKKPEDIGDTTPLFGEGLGLDSIDALELVVAIEQEFGIKVDDGEVGVKAFQSVDSLAAFIRGKTGAP
jgi:acyl carrier protein